jgi:hypothetical protein
MTCHLLTAKASEQHMQLSTNTACAAYSITSVTLDGSLSSLNKNLEKDVPITTSIYLGLKTLLLLLVVAHREGYNQFICGSLD